MVKIPIPTLAVRRTLTPQVSASSDTTNVGRSQFITQSGAIDLTEIELNPCEKELPKGWKKMRHNVTGHTMYVNANDMQSQKQSPVATADTQAETYGEGR